MPKAILVHFQALFPQLDVLACRTPGNRSGCLILAVAENRLSTDLLAQKLCGGLQTIPGDIYGYPPGRGMLRLRSSLAQYAQRTFMKVQPSFDLMRSQLMLHVL